MGEYEMVSGERTGNERREDEQGGSERRRVKRSDGGKPGNSVVVPALDAPSCVTFLRSLGRRGVRTIVTSASKNDPSFYSRYCDERVVVPSPEAGLIAYKDELLELARRPDVRTIVPMDEADAYVLSKYREEFAEHVAALWPPFETLRTAHDRIRLVEAAQHAGVSVPETRLLGDWTATGRDCIVKPRYAILGQEYVESMSADRLFEPNSTIYLSAGTEPNHDWIRAEMAHEPIVQEYVDGTEYAFWALYDRGEPVATCQKHQLRAWNYSGGTSVCRETCHIPALEAAGRRLLDRLDWHGLASVQFMREDSTGEFVLLEVNPRTWISVSAAVRAGADFPYYYWQLAGGSTPEEQPPYKEGVATHMLRGEISYLASVRCGANPVVEPPPFRRAAWEVARSLYDQPNLDYFSVDDPGPLVRRLLASVTNQATSAVFGDRRSDGSREPTDSEGSPSGERPAPVGDG